MEIVNIEASAFMEMNDILFKIEKQLKGLNSSKSELNEWLDNQDVCILMNISDRKLLSLRQKGLIPFSRIDRKIYLHFYLRLFLSVSLNIAQFKSKRKYKTKENKS